MHDVVIVGVPLLAILAGILFSRNDVKELRAEISGIRNDVAALRAEMHTGFNRIDSGLRQFIT